jgi:hypothetical protein
LCKACGVADAEAAMSATAAALTLMADDVFEHDEDVYYEVLDTVFGQNSCGRTVH